VPFVSDQPLNGDPAARVVVAGASGFAGALAAQIVWRHPRLELAEVTARADAGTRLDRLYPRYRVPLTLRELELGGLEDLDAAIVAYPHGAAAPVVAGMRGLGLLVVDLSADFRLRDLPTYERWYGPHGDPDLLTGAVYGLPELHREHIADAELVANPGCYPTAALLALAPLAAEGLIEDAVIDAKSGVSGAGRGGEEMHFVSLDENAKPYKVSGHRHQPEIEQELGRLGASAPITFVPHLLPLDQGELASCYVRTSRPLAQDELEDLYARRYANEPFVEITDEPPGVRDVRDTNLCRIHVQAGDGRVMVFAAIDNLWKGAAGQAVQNLNLMLGLAETEGLE
jgi:N-acetyl-gamma-glutamyl-phosphate reductase